MERIKSFTIDHMTLLPGVYVSREDEAGTSPVTTYDVRLTRPNFEPVMNTGEVHTIEHIGATYLRNLDGVKEKVIYWGPMGCRTGFYLIMAGEPDLDAVKALMKEVFAFVADFEGAIPGATPVECGNYSDMDLP
ncbi:MAG: S-ribosylhomocysteine lyase, partial [Clostridia bacterium]|nr:S-ribosylhomocysteine lyase [Clostridia bacterium]